MNHLSQEDILVRGISLAAQYSGFARGKVTENEPGLGVTIAYHGQNLDNATIYIYDKSLAGIPDGPMSQLALQEFDQATRDGLALPEYVPNTTVKLVDRYGTGSPERGQEFLCAEFILTEVKELRRSFLYLTGASGNFLKIRVTLVANDATNPKARNFADAVASGLWKI